MLKQIGVTVIAAPVIVYMVSVSLAFPYFSYEFAREHGFLEWLWFGERIPALQAFGWPYYAWDKLNAPAPDDTSSLLAEQGNADAQNELGLKYENGRGVQQDFGEAVRWYRKAADQGLAMAESNIGTMYIYGRGVPRDYDEAMKWYRKAADQNLPLAQFNIGTMYLNGNGVRQDYAEAMKWYRRAADQGLADAHYNLGTMYRDGLGVHQDYVQAHKWYSLAAASVPASETENRTRAVKNRDRIAAKMTTAQIAEAEKLAREWKPTLSLLAEQGNAEAQNKLGLEVQDDADAVKWFRKAADQDLALAQNNLGSMYREGRGVSQDYAEALRWFRKAADQGSAQAQTNLGFVYMNGLGVPQDYAKAVAWYRKGAEQGLAEAQNNLGGMYDTGRGVQHDDAEAVKWFRKAADQGLALAQFNLAICYGTGQSVPQDDVHAYKWLNLAIARFPASESKKRDEAIKLRDLLAGKMRPAQIAEAQKLVREWKPQ
jgi:uncharacterized protein